MKLIIWDHERGWFPQLRAAWVSFRKYGMWIERRS